MKDIFIFLLGAAVGAIFALLETPQSGAELRATTKTAAQSGRQKLQAGMQSGMRKARRHQDQTDPEPAGTSTESEAGETA